MIIDDSVTIRAMMEQVLLHDHQFEVAGIASSVDEARQMMRTISHDVVTLDLSMPDIGGLEFLDELSTRTHAPIVVVSSSTRSESPAAAEALEHGAFACFDKARLVADVRGFLGVLRKAATGKKRAQ
ncbi:response regulator [Sphingomonas sp. So64.6b]|uniref:response regulator n=1 Tax=Sphingomonas sp. So64.6b TaxID=2997354 RepID=UPI0015FECA28|nr:response regulator [Sphingomonas sp. So64.6b]QNA82660.1 response regulator [Sphingomonas sp. So64.6b]